MTGDATFTIGPEETLTLTESFTWTDEATMTATMSLTEETASVTPTSTKAYPTNLPPALRPLAEIAVKLSPQQKREERKSWIRRRWNL